MNIIILLSILSLMMCSIILLAEENNYLQVLEPNEPTAQGYNAESVQAMQHGGQDR